MDLFKQAHSRLCGPVVPLKIPYDAEERIDFDNLSAYVDRLCREGAPVLLLTYGSAEYAFLSDDEIFHVTRAVGEAAQGRTFFIAANNFWPIAKTVEYVEHARRCGADAVKVHLHWKFKYSEQGVFDFYKRIANATEDVPLLAYSDFQPGMPVSVAKRLAEEVPQFIGMKNDSDQMAGQYNYMRKTGPDFEAMSAGTMRSMLFCHPYGTRSYLCPIAPFQPRLALDFYELVEAGRYNEAKRYVTDYEEPLMDLVPRFGCHWQVFIRVILHIAGCLDCPRPRLPFSLPPDDRIEWLRREFERIGFEPMKR